MIQILVVTGQLKLCSPMRWADNPFPHVTWSVYIL